MVQGDRVTVHYEHDGEPYGVYWTTATGEFIRDKQGQKIKLTLSPAS
jgi:hypothetical protein